MEYRLKVQGQEVPITVDLLENKNVKAVIGQNDFSVEYSFVSDNEIHLNIDGKCINAYITDTQDGKTIFINGNYYHIINEDTLARSRTGKNRNQNTPEIVTPPMPAVVVSIMVSAGETVEKGQGVIVISAMKMETTLKAPFNGTIKNINAAEGDKVNPGDVLIDIEKED